MDVPSFLGVLAPQPTVNLTFLSVCRRRRAASQAWRPLEVKKSRRRRFSSVWWAPRGWASASPAVRHRNPASTSVMSSQALFLQKLDSRWSLKVTRTPLWSSESLHTGLLWTASVSLFQNVDWRPDRRGERGGFHQHAPQRGELCSFRLFIRFRHQSLLILHR